MSTVLSDTTGGGGTMGDAVAFPLGGASDEATSDEQEGQPEEFPARFAREAQEPARAADARWLASVDAVLPAAEGLPRSGRSDQLRLEARLV